MSVARYQVRRDDLSGAAVRALLELHLQQMHAWSPPGSVYALGLSGLLRVDVTVWSAWRGDELASVGALRTLGDGTAELKSMRTHPAFLRQGAAAAILDHIITVARERGLTRLSLETGSGAAFEPALALYRRRGFVDGDAFGGYQHNGFSQFLHLSLAHAATATPDAL